MNTLTHTRTPLTFFITELYYTITATLYHHASNHHKYYRKYHDSLVTKHIRELIRLGVSHSQSHPPGAPR